MMPFDKTVYQLALSACVCVVLTVGLSGSAFGSVVPSDGGSPAPSGPAKPAPVKPPAVGSTPETESSSETRAADALEIHIMQALDKPVSLNATKMPIGEAIQTLASEAGIAIELEPVTLDLLPYGSKTLLSAKIERRPLGESLTAMLRPLGLTLRAEKRRVAIAPTKPLRRIVRRATWEELALLERLQSNAWSRELFGSLHFQFPHPTAGDYPPNREALLRAGDEVGGGSMAEVLEHVCDQYGWSWYPSGEFIVVLSKVKQVERQLEKHVTLRYVQTTLENALLDLADQAGVLLKMDPGVIASMSPQEKDRFSLSIENATIRQALEVVAGQTGLGYTIEPEGIRLSSSAKVPLPAASGDAGGAEAVARALRTNSIVGQVTFHDEDGASYSFFIREDDLPPEVNDLRKKKIEKAINEIRRLLFTEQGQD